MNSECVRLWTHHGLLGNRPRSNINTLVSRQTRAINSPRRAVVVSPGDVSVVARLVLETVDCEAPSTLSVAFLEGMSDESIF